LRYAAMRGRGVAHRRQTHGAMTAAVLKLAPLAALAVVTFGVIPNRRIGGILAHRPVYRRRGDPAFRGAVKFKPRPWRIAC
jgi:hypothetical protein